MKFNMKFHVYNLLGHGEMKAISFETKYAELYAMDVTTLRSLLEASRAASKTKIVVVSACHSEEAGKTFLEAGKRGVWTFLPPLPHFFLPFSLPLNSFFFHP